MIMNGKIIGAQIKKVKCPLCNGKGEILDIYYEKCKKCRGCGIVYNYVHSYRYLCEKCKGAGYYK